MEQRTIIRTLRHFFVSLTTELKRSTRNELRNIMTVFNTRVFATSSKKDPTSNLPLTSMITDAKLSSCIRMSIDFLKEFIHRMETDGSGIPVTGGSVEAWRMDNIAVDIVSHNIKLHKISDFEIDQLNVKLDEGIIELTARWPNSFLSQSYVLNGFLEGKRATGKGELKITVEDFKVNISMKFSDKGDKLRIDDFKIRTDFANAAVQVSGLAVEESTNGEEVMNQALQREKQKLKEILMTNTLILSEQTAGILNSKLETMTKRQMVDVITSWCDSR